MPTTMVVPTSHRGSSWLSQVQSFVWIWFFCFFVFFPLSSVSFEFDFFLACISVCWHDLSVRRKSTGPHASEWPNASGLHVWEMRFGGFLFVICRFTTCIVSKNHAWCRPPRTWWAHRGGGSFQLRSWRAHSGTAESQQSTLLSESYRDSCAEFRHAVPILWERRILLKVST